MDRLPPYDEEAEQAVLGAVFHQPDLMDLCAEQGLASESFYTPANQSVFSAFLKLYKKHRPIDILTVARAIGDVSLVGGEIYLHKLMDACYSITHAQHYIQIVKDKEKLRDIIRITQTAQAEVYTCDDAETLRSELEYNISNLENVGCKTTDTPEDLIDKEMEMCEKAAQTGCAGLSTGYKMLDNYFGGLLPAALYYVSGKGGCCKTTLARNIIENISGYSRNPEPTAFFTLEQPASKIWLAIACRHAQQSMYWLQRGDKSRVDFARIEESKKIVKDWPIDVIDGMQTPTSLWSACRRGVKKRKWKAVVLDYIQKLAPDKGVNYGANIEAKATADSETVRQIALKLHTPMVVLSALSYDGNLRGSSMMGHDAWAHIRLEQCKTWPADLHIDVHFEKQRFGPPVQNEKLILIGDEQRLDEPRFRGVDGRPI